MRRTIKRAFTLIELLVVIAVIALLIGMLLPALGRARASTRIAVCLSNIRGQNDAILMYNNTYKEAMPPRWISWTTVENDDPNVGFWLINRVLAQFMGTPMEKPEVGFPVPTGMFRCPEVKAGQDDQLRFAHSGYIHASPNKWLFNTMNRNDITGTIKIFGEMLPGWSEKYGPRYWRRMSALWRPSSVLTLSDNVAYWYEPHKHNEARESIGRRFELLRLPHDNDDDTDNIGAHDALGVRPASFADGHGASLPISHEYWNAGLATYYANGAASPEAVQLSDAEVTAFMWFIGSRDKASGD